MASKKVPDKKLVDLAFRIKPVMEDAKGELRFAKPVDIYKTPLDEDVKLGAKASGLKKLNSLRTVVPGGFRRIDAPTVAIALGKIPRHRLRNVAAFKIEINSGSYSGEDAELPATLTLYEGKLPQRVKDQPVVALGKIFTAAAKPVAAVVPPAPQAIVIMKPLMFKKPEVPGPGGV